jgi:cell division protease FtsH
VNEAALLAGRKNRKKVGMQDFEEARDKILLGAEREEKIDEDERKLIAFHEAGHALTAVLLPYTDPLQKVTIIPRGRTLGATEQAPEKDRHNYSRSYLINRLQVMMAGRVAEKVIFNDITNGSAQDLKEATRLTRRMVCNWGMSDRIGPVTFTRGEEYSFLGRELAQERDFSEDTARIIDEEINRMITEAERATQSLIEDHRNELEAIANALLIHETLEKEDILRIMSGGSPRQKKREEIPAAEPGAVPEPELALQHDEMGEDDMRPPQRGGS